MTKSLTIAAEALEAAFRGVRDATRWEELDRGVRERVAEASAAVSTATRKLAPSASGTESEQRAACRKQFESLGLDLVQLLAGSPGDVRWIEDGHAISAPLDVSGMLAKRLLAPTPVVFVSATLRVGGSFATAERQLGLDRGQTHKRQVRQLVASSPFDYPRSVRYVANDLPHPTKAVGAFDSGAADRCEKLVRAAGGRALLLFSTTRARDEFASRLRPRLEPDYPVLVQGDLPDKLLMSRFKVDPTSCLFGTLSLWQGVDVPGPSLSLVTIDRVPFRPPTDPLTKARQDAVGAAGFAQVSVPAAAVLMMQAVGRLLRSEADRGVVAILDPRMVGATGWAPTIAAGLPPMQPTTDLARTLDFLVRLDRAARSRDEGPSDAAP